MNKVRGFTLIEVLVALLIFSISAGVIMLLVSQSNSVAKKGIDFAKVEQNYNKVLVQIKESGVEDKYSDDNFEYEQHDLNEKIIVGETEYNITDENYSTLVIKLKDPDYTLEKIIHAEK